ncbi:MAG: hypothetical protein RL637_878 [Pseudomonadota bacterium]|jgi:hypothetical protein
MLHITQAEYKRDFLIEVAFNDGRSGVADLSSVLKGSVFEELKDVIQFAQFELDKELNTLVWKNGADLAPEFIYYCAFKDDAELADRFREWGYI